VSLSKPYPKNPPESMQYSLFCTQNTQQKAMQPGPRRTHSAEKARPKINDVV